MKSSYKLFSVFWDHKDTTDICKCPYLDVPYSFDYKDSLCLLDDLDCYRTIKISELLDIDNEDEWYSICNQLRLFNRIALVIDYLTVPSSLISSQYYLKRLCQIYHALLLDVPDAMIVVNIPENLRDSWIKLTA